MLYEWWIVKSRRCTDSSRTGFLFYFRITKAINGSMTRYTRIPDCKPFINTYYHVGHNFFSVPKKWELRIWNLGQIFEVELWMVGQKPKWLFTKAFCWKNLKLGIKLWKKFTSCFFPLIFSFTKIVLTATAANAAYKKVLTLPMALSKAYRGLRSFLPSSAVVI